MKEKKNIDRLFQERFKDFEATPSDAVWKNIESQLNQKKNKRRVIPVWWRYAGVAALLLLFLTIGGLYFNTNNTNTVTPTNQVVDTKKEVVEPSKSNNTNDFDKPNQETDANDDDSSGLESKTSHQTPQNTVIKSPASAIANNLSETKPNLSNSEKEKAQQPIQNPLVANDALAAVNSEVEEKTKSTVDQSNTELNKPQEKNTVLNTDQTTIAKVTNEAIDSVTNIQNHKTNHLALKTLLLKQKLLKKRKRFKINGA